MKVVIKLLKENLGCVYGLVNGVCACWAPNVGVEGEGIDAFALGELDLGARFTVQLFRGCDHPVCACTAREQIDSGPDYAAKKV